MKKIIVLGAAAVVMFTFRANNATAVSYPGTTQSQDSTYGESFTPTGAITVPELYEAMKEKKRIENVVVEGELAEVCQAMGRWVKLKNEKGENIFVRTKDHAYFVPKDIAGKKVILKGIARVETSSVETLRHYAADAGKSKKEIKKIKEPKEEIIIEASGIIVKN